jgi:mRNA interferase RelE/StbE
LKKLDLVIVRKIAVKVEKYLVKNPQQLGEPLKGQYKGLHRFRFSKYRVIYQIKEQELVILVVKVGHRREVY